MNFISNHPRKIRSMCGRIFKLPHPPHNLRKSNIKLLNFYIGTTRFKFLLKMRVYKRAINKNKKPKGVT